MKTSNNGLHFISRWEGLRRNVYNDVAGKATIGVGHLLTTKEKQTGVLVTGVHWRNGLTEAQAVELLRHDVTYAERTVEKLITVPLSQPQFDALVSFTFNLGRRNLQKSTLRNRLNAGDYASVPDQLMRWNKAGGKAVKGLINRRRAEGAMWRSAEVKSLIKSRTNQGVAVAGVGQVVNLITEATQISRASSGLVQAFGEYAQWVGIVITLAGIAYVLYARWDDRRNGIR